MGHNIKITLVLYSEESCETRQCDCLLVSSVKVHLINKTWVTGHAQRVNNWYVNFRTLLQRERFRSIMENNYCRFSSLKSFKRSLESLESRNEEVCNKNNSYRPRPLSKHQDLPHFHHSFNVNAFL